MFLGIIVTLAILAIVGLFIYIDFYAEPMDCFRVVIKEETTFRTDKDRLQAIMNLCFIWLDSPQDKDNASKIMEDIFKIAHDVTCSCGQDQWDGNMFELDSPRETPANPLEFSCKIVKNDDIPGDDDED